MSLWANLVKAYNANEEMLSDPCCYPLSSTSFTNKDYVFDVHIDENGEFRNIYLIDKKAKNEESRIFNVPVSEESSGRTAEEGRPHPLFIQYKYIKECKNKKGEKDKNLFELYLDELKAFAMFDNAPDVVKAVYVYVSKQTIKDDIQAWWQRKHKTAKKMPPINEKAYVLFSVEAQGCANSELWQRKELFTAWHKFYLQSQLGKYDERKMLEIKSSKLSKDINAVEKELAGCKKNKDEKNKKEVLRKRKTELKREKSEIDKILKDLKQKGYISVGKDDITGVHGLLAISPYPKNITRYATGAKLISTNDMKNFTFRGRFLEASEAFSVGYESSQKAHQFLRYIVREQGSVCGEQVLVSFTVENLEEYTNLLPKPPTADDDLGLDDEDDAQTDAGIDFAEALRHMIGGYISEKDRGVVKSHVPTCVVMLDAATTGRLSITYYRELAKDEYIESLAQWHENCRWKLKYWDKKQQQYRSYMGAPTIDKIIDVVYGNPRGARDQGYNKLKKNARSVLTKCIFDNYPIPFNYINSAIRRVSNPVAIAKKAHFDRDKFLSMLSTTCALYKGFLNHQPQKDEINMSIELDRLDRDYLYGRLLAAADMLEESILKSSEKARLETAAIRYMQVFSQRPYSTWATIHRALSPYLAKTKHWVANQEMQKVMERFSCDEFKDDRPLSGLYLIGYYHEREYISTRLKELKASNNENDLTTEQE